MPIKAPWRRRAQLAGLGLIVIGAAALWWAHETGRLVAWLPFLAPLPITYETDAAQGTGSLLRVSDGDTVVVRYHDLVLHVRIRNLDTPESVHPDPSRNSALGAEVSAWAKAHLDGQRVRIEFQRDRAHPWAIAEDRHGRALADLWIDRGPPGPDESDELFSETVIRRGFSRYEVGFGRSDRYHARLSAAESAARAAGLGVWAK